ncbi:hypothetical protein [Bacillus taeanensis]|uniref:Uncharacterized protein n=1 Tax=Bacillus taeanensis TaxID=273032 RepID=A0A366XPV7_9BACI|nr:hypothetical protein [Bacillus taeanensis]RBW67937.1 hypothetical protein DS031_19210 [Bacillus taeanensis]
MFEKVLFLVILYFGMLCYDLPKLKQKNRPERIVYAMLMVPLLYLSLIYVLDLAWPTPNKLVDFFFSKPAQKIVEIIKVTM